MGVVGCRVKEPPLGWVRPPATGHSEKQTAPDDMRAGIGVAEPRGAGDLEEGWGRRTQPTCRPPGSQRSIKACCRQSRPLGH